MGKKCQFDGRTIFYKHPGSTIVVGDHCRFNSLTVSTQAGINRPCSLWTSSPEARIIIEEGCGFSGTAIACHKSIIIKKNVKIGSNTLIMDSDQHLDDPRAGMAKPIVISENVWIGSNAIILKGVVIGKNSLIAAGSLVNKDIPENTVAAGVPAKEIKRL
nr:acyltransferase [Desulfobacula sp.]